MNSSPGSRSETEHQDPSEDRHVDGSAEPGRGQAQTEAKAQEPRERQEQSPGQPDAHQEGGQGVTGAPQCAVGDDPEGVEELVDRTHHEKRPGKEQHRRIVGEDPEQEIWQEDEERGHAYPR